MCVDISTLCNNNAILLIFFICRYDSFILHNVFSPIPETCNKDSISLSITDKVSFPKQFTIFSARDSPIPSIIPDDRYLCISAEVSGFATSINSALNCMPKRGC